MSSERNLTRDLHSILNSFLDLIGCDGGSIYTLEKNIQGESVLVFKAMITRSLGISDVPPELRAIVFRLNEQSLAGKTGLKRKVFKESYSTSNEQMTADGATVTPGRNFIDEVIQYDTRNILSAPLMTPSGDLVGVVQLVNKNAVNAASGEWSEFDAKDERLCAIVSAQAALAIENSTLLVEQEKILDGFVNACVTAIEARDPVTAGHSQRVCDFTLNLAQAVNRVEAGELSSLQFSDVQLREIRYAAMLHDIGKISVREDILKKEKKLYPWEMELIEMRFKLMKLAVKHELEGANHEFEFKKKMRDLDQALMMIKCANEPTVLPKDVSDLIVGLTKLEVKIDDQEACCALHAKESEKLCIPKGSLSKEERLDIEKHVSFTYEILKMVPWSRGLGDVPVIAHRHHEKLDGSGYPLKVKAPEIPVQSRMITICDIYDALTASDRPYKAAVPIEGAIKILEEEMRQGKLDGQLLKLFIESKSYLIPRASGRQKVKKAA